MSTLHDRITALADEWEASVDGLVAKGTNYDDGQAAYAAWAAFHLRAVLAETATTQPEADAPCGRGPCCMPDGHPGTCNPGDDLPPGHPARGWSPQPVEPEPDERETLAAGEDMDRRLLWLDRAAPTPWKVRVVTDGLPSNGPGGHAVVDANGLALVQTDYDEHGYNLAHLIAQAPDLYRAARFRRSRPEAS